MYKLLVFVHILAGVVWLGGGIYAQLFSQRFLSLKSDEAVESYMGVTERVNGVVFSIAPPVALLAGIGLVVWGESWNFAQVWVYLALGLAVVAAAIGGGLESSAAKSAKSALEDEGASGSRFTAAVDRLHRLGWVDVTVVVAILVLMIFKPGI
jgi:uncharacterized membrane protein